MPDDLLRQVIHSEATIGVHKADSAAAACRGINSSIEVGRPHVCLAMLNIRICFPAHKWQPAQATHARVSNCGNESACSLYQPRRDSELLTRYARLKFRLGTAAFLHTQVVAHKDALAPGNALALVQQYDVVVDASDNAPTRYLLSDACVVAGRPLVSGAALGMDGQLTVYNHGQDGRQKPQFTASLSTNLAMIPAEIGIVPHAYLANASGVTYRCHDSFSDCG